MKENEFMEKVKKIEKFYEKELNEVQIEAWWNSLMNMNTAQFDYLIKQIFTEFTYMPKLSQILELKHQVLYDYKSENEKQTEKEYCKKCRSTGVIRYIRTKNDIKYEYFARCVCKNGLNFMSFPLITKVIEEERAKGQPIATTKKVVPQEKNDIKQSLFLVLPN